MPQSMSFQKSDRGDVPAEFDQPYDLQWMGRFSRLLLPPITGSSFHRIPFGGTSEIARPNQYQSFLYAQDAKALLHHGIGVIDGSPYRWDLFQPQSTLEAGDPIYSKPTTAVHEIDAVTMKDAFFGRSIPCSVAISTFIT
jgi:hypothetical protein